MNHGIHTLLSAPEEQLLSDLPDHLRKQADAPETLLIAIHHLLSRQRIRTACLIAESMANAGHINLLVAFARGAGGVLRHVPIEKIHGLAEVSQRAARMPTEKWETFYHAIVTPVITALLNEALQQSDQAQVLRILALAKAAVPRLRPLFDWDAPQPVLSGEAMRQQGRAQARLISYQRPPATLPRPKRRVLVVERDTFFMMPGSRTWDLGLRAVTAMNAYGWQAEVHPIPSPPSVDICPAIVALCQQKRPEILFLDDELLFGMRQARAEMIHALRENHPRLKVVGYLPDSWRNAEALKETVPLLDLAWEWSCPSLPLWQDPAYATKIHASPVPVAGTAGTPDKPLMARMLFAGSISTFNWHRAFWLAAADKRGLPVELRRSTHLDDNLPPLESCARYMRGLTEATCCLNFTMRPDAAHTRAFTARSYEAILSGALLVQESSPEMDHFFISGEHYLPFSSLAELAAVARFLVHNREEAEEIRRAGHAFARERYSDDNLIGYLEHALFYRTP